jgi:DNA-binding XRE family transcriptional regulator
MCLDCFVAFTQYNAVADNGRTAGPGESGIYNRIAVLRAERSVSRQDLADAVGVNYQTIGFLERGDYGPSLKLAFAIAEFFKLPIQAIFSTQPFRPLSEQVYAAGGRQQGSGRDEGQGGGR